MSTKKKFVLAKKEVKHLPLPFECVLGSNETYLSNVSFIESTGKLFLDPVFKKLFNELQQLTACRTCSHILGVNYVTELRP